MACTRSARERSDSAAANASPVAFSVATAESRADADADAEGPLPVSNSHRPASSTLSTLATASTIFHETWSRSITDDTARPASCNATISRMRAAKRARLSLSASVMRLNAAASSVSSSLPATAMW